jgi:hydroxymethylpyrimidine/phosphomethylpyrimidine kinase
MRIPSALTIAGLDSGGGAGIAADLKTFSVLGVHGLSVLTAITAQNTHGIFGILEVPPDFVGKQIDVVASDFDISWTKTGMLSSAKTIKVVGRKAKKYGFGLVVDPVMRSASGHPLLKDEAVSTLIKLFAQAELVTPNLWEAQKLSGVKITSAKGMREAAKVIFGMGPRAVLIKGGHLRGKMAIDLFYDGEKFEKFERRRITTGPLHGTGCSFSSAITAELAKGEGLRDAVLKAKRFIEAAIGARVRVGKGAEPVNPMGQLLSQAERGKTIEEVWAATKFLLGYQNFTKLIPQVGSNIVMALPGAKDVNEVAGLSGRIVRVGKMPHATGFPEFGGSEHVANVVLTAHKHDSKIRAGINIKYSPEVVRICKKLGLKLGTFDRSKEPPGVKTMIWGVNRAIKNAGYVPDIIYDEGSRGKEAMVRILGSSPLEVATLAVKIAERLKDRKDF